MSIFPPEAELRRCYEERGNRLELAEKTIASKNVLIEKLIDEVNSVKAQLNRDIAGENIDLRREIERLKAGDFTPEEFQALCHNLHLKDEPITPQAFCDGCESYQVKLFGESPITSLKAEKLALDQRNDRLAKECNERLEKQREAEAECGEMAEEIGEIIRVMRDNGAKMEGSLSACLDVLLFDLNVQLDNARKKAFEECIECLTALPGKYEKEWKDSGDYGKQAIIDGVWILKNSMEKAIQAIEAVSKEVKP